MLEEIVEAALAQFHERGFNAAAVKDITDRAGVPKGSFYNHFESKEALAIVALERYGEGRRLTDLADRSVEPVARIRAHTAIPVALGFGISRPEHVAEVTKYADAAVVGSALVSLIGEERGSPALIDRVEEYVRWLQGERGAQRAEVSSR